MFRPITRFRQAMSPEECISLLKETRRGVLAVITEDGYPYAMPINHYYNEENGTLFFHGGPTGYKLDCLEACDKVSYCVMDEGVREEGHWALHVRSVIVFGRMHRMEDHEEVLKLSRLLSLRFTQDSAEIEEEVLRSGRRTVGLTLVPEHITGKRVKES